MLCSVTRPRDLAAYTWTHNLLGMNRMHPSQSELLKLKNLGLASVNILHSVGIRSCDDLRRVGPVDAFISIRTRGINASRVMLYALQGALLDVHWNELDPDLKARLANEADRLLSTQRPD